MDREKRRIIADSHALFAEVLKQIVEPEFDVVGVVGDGRVLVQNALTLRSDGIILEVSLPQLNGFQAAEEIARQSPTTKFVFVTANIDPAAAAEAFRRGASAYVAKQSRLDEFLTTIPKVICGESYLSPLIARETMEYLLHPPRGTNPVKQITRRQSEILQLLAEGKSMKEVAQMLDITPGTVAFHKYTVMAKLSIESNAELLQFAMAKYFAPTQWNWAIAV